MRRNYGSHSSPADHNLNSHNFSADPLLTDLFFQDSLYSAGSFPVYPAAYFRRHCRIYSHPGSLFHTVGTFSYAFSFSFPAYPPKQLFPLFFKNMRQNAQQDNTKNHPCSSCDEHNHSHIIPPAPASHFARPDHIIPEGAAFLYHLHYFPAGSDIVPGLFYNIRQTFRNFCFPLAWHSVWLPPGKKEPYRYDNSPRNPPEDERGFLLPFHTPAYSGTRWKDCTLSHNQV